MARIRGCEALVEFLDDEEVPSNFSYIEDFEPTEEKVPAVSTLKKDHRGYVHCACGHLQHFNKLKCDNCGFCKERQQIDWDQMKSRAPVSAPYTTKRLFQRVCQLHAAHDRDVVVFIHYKDTQDTPKFRLWGTPGPGRQFLSGKMGSAIKDAWFFHMDNAEEIQKQSVGRKRKATTRIQKKAKVAKVEEAVPIVEETPEARTEAGESSESDPEVYRVEKILQKRNKGNGKVEYLVKWAGWTNEFNSWEPEAHIIDKNLILNL